MNISKCLNCCSLSVSTVQRSALHPLPPLSTSTQLLFLVLLQLAETQLLSEKEHTSVFIWSVGTDRKDVEEEKKNQQARLSRLNEPPTKGAGKADKNIRPPYGLELEK